MSDDADRLLSGQSWHDFCDRLRAVGDTILGDEFPQSDRDRTEGFRYLTRLLSYAMLMEVEGGDPVSGQESDERLPGGGELIAGTER